MFYSPKYCGYFLFHFEFKRLKIYTIMYRRQNTSWGVNLINSFDRIKSVAFLFNCLQIYASYLKTICKSLTILTQGGFNWYWKYLLKLGLKCTTMWSTIILQELIFFKWIISSTFWCILYYLDISICMPKNPTFIVNSSHCTVWSFFSVHFESLESLTWPNAIILHPS